MRKTQQEWAEIINREAGEVARAFATADGNDFDTLPEASQADLQSQAARHVVAARLLRS